MLELIYRSRGGLSANKKEENNASDDDHTDICQRTLTGQERIFLSQMEAFVLIIFQLFFAIRKLGILLGYSPVLAAEYLVT